MREELELNRERWNEATRIHTRGNVYGVEDFKAGACRLHRVEVEEIGDVKGKRLLHLQCHFGIDTLSWSRRRCSRRRLRRLARYSEMGSCRDCGTKTAR